ncbi:MAG TPA: tetratricopeptide repeat protein [Terriglobales bacterium]|nr:tetratricopeptide repeat protein [Terriglobales bacterium]
MDRLQMLTQVVNENPNDAFARYGLAMEYSKLNEVETAMGHFRRLVELHPDYAAGYFMAAQLLARVGRVDEAKTFLTQGIAAAARSGNAHAKGEMEGMLAELG